MWTSTLRILNPYEATRESVLRELAEGEKTERRPKWKLPALKLPWR